MCNSVKWARKQLKYVSKYKNMIQRSSHPHSMFALNNLAANLFGPPMIQLCVSDRKKGRLYWKRDPEGKWARIGDKFFFIDPEHMALFDQYRSAEFVKIY